MVAGSIVVLVGLSINSTLRRHRSATLLITALSFAILAGVFIGYRYLNQFDQGLMTLIQEHRSSAVDATAVLVTRLGDFRTLLFASSLLTILLLVARQWRQAIFAGSTLLCTALANTGTKWFFARVRPEILTDPLTSYSMPSGHSSGSFALFLTLAVLAGRGQPPRMRLIWLLLGCLPALSIAMSRVYLGAHWPTDVLAGAMLAACISAASLNLNQRQSSLGAMSAKVWWLVLPALVALFGFFALWHLPNAMERYAY
jgi:undecaprenyl-diphosphatase